MVGQFLAPQRLVVGLNMNVSMKVNVNISQQSPAFSFFDNVDDEIDLEADPILNQVKRNNSTGAATMPSTSTGYAMQLLKSYAFSNAASLARDPYSYVFTTDSGVDSNTAVGTAVQPLNNAQKNKSSIFNMNNKATALSSGISNAAAVDSTVYCCRDRPILNWIRRKLNVLANRARDVFVLMYVKTLQLLQWAALTLKEAVCGCVSCLANPNRTVLSVTASASEVIQEAFFLSPTFLLNLRLAVEWILCEATSIPSQSRGKYDIFSNAMLNVLLYVDRVVEYCEDVGTLLLRGRTWSWRA